MIFSETQLVELDKIFRDHLQEHDKGIANLGILLISDVRKGRLALTAANKPLEALAEQMKSKPFSEISEGVQDQLLMAVHEVETVLDSHICNRPPSDINDHLEICHIDPRACEESLETKEYFQCHVNGETNIFKFTLHPQTGVFQLHTYLIKNQDFGGDYGTV